MLTLQIEESRSRLEKELGDYAFLMAFVCFFSYMFGKGIGGEGKFGETGDLVFLVVVGIPLLAGLSRGTIGLDLAWLTIGIAALAGVWGVRNGRRTVKQLGRTRQIPPREAEALGDN